VTGISMEFDKCMGVLSCLSAKLPIFWNRKLKIVPNHLFSCLVHFVHTCFMYICMGSTIILYRYRHKYFKPVVRLHLQKARSRPPQTGGMSWPANTAQFLKGLVPSIDIGLKMRVVCCGYLPTTQVQEKG
jgi:hypothetical protein